MICSGCGCYGHISRNCSTLKVPLVEPQSGVSGSPTAISSPVPGIPTAAMDTVTPTLITDTRINMGEKKEAKIQEPLHGDWLTVSKKKKNHKSRINAPGKSHRSNDWGNFNRFRMLNEEGPKISGAQVLKSREDHGNQQMVYYSNDLKGAGPSKHIKNGRPSDKKRLRRDVQAHKNTKPHARNLGVRNIVSVLSKPSSSTAQVTKVPSLTQSPGSNGQILKEAEKTSSSANLGSRVVTLKQGLNGKLRGVSLDVLKPHDPGEPVSTNVQMEDIDEVIRIGLASIEMENAARGGVNEVTPMQEGGV